MVKNRFYNLRNTNLWYIINIKEPYGNNGVQNESGQTLFLLNRSLLIFYNIIIISYHKRHLHFSDAVPCRNLLLYHSTGHKHSSHFRKRKLNNTAYIPAQHARYHRLYYNTSSSALIETTSPGAKMNWSFFVT